MFKKLFRFLFKLLLMLVGLVFIASLMLAGLLLLAIWLLRALFARLSGQPVRPWTFTVNRQAVWQRFSTRPGHAPRAPTPPDVIDAEVKEIR